MSRMLAPELRAVIKKWPVQSPATRRMLVLKGVCPDCGKDAPGGVWTGGGTGGMLPMRCYGCGFVERDTPAVRAYEAATKR